MNSKHLVETLFDKGFKDIKIGKRTISKEFVYHIGMSKESLQKINQKERFIMKNLLSVGGLRNEFRYYWRKIDDIEVSISHRIIELFSAGLYSSPNKAFEELVCNSYDAFASKVAVYVPSDSTVEGAYIWVCDNGEGLNPKELKNLWRIGESTKRQGNVRDKKRLQIGQFGIGKLATYILARN